MILAINIVPRNEYFSIVTLESKSPGKNKMGNIMARKFTEVVFTLKRCSVAVGIACKKIIDSNVVLRENVTERVKN